MADMPVSKSRPHQIEHFWNTTEFSLKITRFIQSLKYLSSKGFDLPSLVLETTMLPQCQQETGERQDF